MRCGKARPDTEVQDEPTVAHRNEAQLEVGEPRLSPISQGVLEPLTRGVGAFDLDPDDRVRDASPLANADQEVAALSVGERREIAEKLDHLLLGARKVALKLQRAMLSHPALDESQKIGKINPVRQLADHGGGAFVSGGKGSDRLVASDETSLEMTPGIAVTALARKPKIGLYGFSGPNPLS